MNVSHTLATYLLFRNFNATTVADNALVTNTLVFTAMALVILNRTEDALAEQTIALRLVRTIVNRFRLQNLATGILQDLLRRSQADRDF